jgi:hypothetical protein
MEIPADRDPGVQIGNPGWLIRSMIGCPRNKGGGFVMRRMTLVLLGMMAVAVFWPQGARAQTEADALAAQFVSPPDSAKPQTWWHWMNGCVTREGITADLEAMKRVGLGGATMFNVDQCGAMMFNVDCSPIDDSSVQVLNPKWRELVRFAGEEAARLGLNLGVHNATGWSSSGGPWIKVEQSMQRVVWAEQEFKGPGKFSGVLKKPKVDEKWNYYRDIAVLALRANGAVIERGSVVDLTDKMDERGVLNWDAPVGVWTIMRFGHTTTGSINEPSPESGAGWSATR